MKPFTKIGATHFVSNFSADASVIGLSVQDYLNTLPSGLNTFSEGTQQFAGLRDCLLRESERSLLLAGNCYARALDGLRECAAYWSVVGLYYASFFSTKAILGMHGCWMNRPKLWIEVMDANPGAQKLALRRSSYPCSHGETGSHKVAWVSFYEAMNHLAAWLTTANATLAANPVNASRTWMIDTRNELNYDPLDAFEMMAAFQASFNPANIPLCFGGKLQTMMQMAQAFVLFAKETAIANSLHTDVWMPSASRLDWSRTYVTSMPDPALVAYAASEYPQLEY